MSKTITTILCGFVLAALPALAQDEDAPDQNPASGATQNPPPAGQTTSAPSTNVAAGAPERRFFYGARILYFPLKQFKTNAEQAETTNPLADYTYSANSAGQKAALAATFEYVITRRLSAGVEFYLTHTKYIWTTMERTGLPSPNSSTDDRPVTTTTQSTDANLWVLPVLARYQGIRSKGKLARLYWLGGPEYRHVGRVRTGNDIYYPDGTTGYNETPAVPNHRNQIGIVAGIGMRFFDQFGFKLTPELRYIRWNNSSFQGPGYASTKNEAEATLGFSF